MGGWQWAKLRAAVRERDGGCVRCGSTVRLEVHHVLPLVEGGSNEPGNLITLCRRCHGRSHRADGG
jgi:ATP-dependent DNA helicase RecQ